MLKSFSMVGLLVCLTMGCSQPKKPDHKAIIVTHITPEGLKQFQYSVTKPSDAKKGGKGRGTQRPGGKGGGGKGGMRGQSREMTSKRGENNKQRSSGRMNKRIEEKLFNTGYCREGFMEIDHYSEAGRYYFNGQCNEKATAKDRPTFKNQ